MGRKPLFSLYHFFTPGTINKVIVRMQIYGYGFTICFVHFFQKIYEIEITEILFFMEVVF